jgi:hypothetical protein
MSDYDGIFRAAEIAFVVMVFGGSIGAGIILALLGGLIFSPGWWMVIPPIIGLLIAIYIWNEIRDDT